MSKIKETINKIRYNYAVDTDEPPMSIYYRVRANLESELYTSDSEVTIDTSLDDKISQAVLELSANYTDIPTVSETETRIGAGSALPQIYAIAAAWPARTMKAFKSINRLR